jgi:hypothetical protein
MDVVGFMVAPEFDFRIGIVHFFKPYLLPSVTVTADLRVRRDLSLHWGEEFCQGFLGANSQICGH